MILDITLYSICEAYMYGSSILTFCLLVVLFFNSLKDGETDGAGFASVIILFFVCFGFIIKYING